MNYQYGDIMRAFLSIPENERIVWVRENAALALYLLLYFRSQMEELSKKDGMGI